MPKKDPLYPHMPKSQLRKRKEERTYTLPELTEIAKIFYEAQMAQRATVYAWTPMYTRWENLTPEVRAKTIHGLEERIERECLRGYLERKRPIVGYKLTEAIISELERANYLRR